MTDYGSAAGLIMCTEKGDDVSISYNSPWSNDAQTATGEVISSERGLGVRFETDDGNEYEVFGSEVGDRDTGAVHRNGRKIGSLIVCDEGDK